MAPNVICIILYCIAQTCMYINVAFQSKTGVKYEETIALITLKNKDKETCQVNDLGI